MQGDELLQKRYMALDYPYPFVILSRKTPYLSFFGRHFQFVKSFGIHISRKGCLSSN